MTAPLAAASTAAWSVEYTVESPALPPHQLPLFQHFEMNRHRLVLLSPHYIGLPDVSVRHAARKIPASGQLGL